MSRVSHLFLLWRFPIWNVTLRLVQLILLRLPEVWLGLSFFHLPLHLSLLG